MALDPTTWEKLCEQRYAFDPPDRSRIEWRVSSLGREKCRAIWELFDRDGDDRWTYTEFLEYATAVEQRIGKRPSLKEICVNDQVWRMVMNDSYELDERRRLTFNGFLLLREAREHEYPLVNDLTPLGISLEWASGLGARRVVSSINEYVDREGIAPIKLIQFLAGECGVLVTYWELWQTILRQRLFHRCHRYLLGQKRTLRLFGYKQKSTLQLTNPSLDEDPRVCRAGLIALLLSSWAPSERTKWRTFFLRFRLGCYGALRRWKRNVATLFEWTKKAAQTGLLRASCLQSNTDRELGDYVFKLEVGPAFTAHATIHLTYYSDADSAATLHELKYLEREAECFAYLDLNCRSGTRDTDAQWLCQRLQWFVDLYFKEHLELLPHFFKWFVHIPTKMQLRVGGGGSSGLGTAAGAAPVIRIVLLFTGAMDLYAVMQSLNLPSSMQFDHLLQRLSMRWMFSHSIEELVTNKRFVAGTQWSCRGQLDVRLNRQAWGQIFHQCAARMDDHVTMEQEEQVFMAQQREERRQNGAKGNHSSLKCDIDTAATSLDCAEKAPLSWRHWLRRTGLVLDSSKEINLTSTFDDLKSMLEGNSWVKTVMSRTKFAWWQRLFNTAGGIANEWKELGDSLRAEFAATRFVKSVVTANGAAANALLSARSSAGRHTSLSPVSSRPSLPSAASTLSGVSSSSSLMSADEFIGGSIASSFPFASPVSTPVVPGTTAETRWSSVATSVLEDEPSRYEQEDPLEHDLLELYEACAKTLQSVHSLRAEAGTSGVVVAFEGWNVFSILPRLVPMTAASKASLVQTRSSASTGGGSAGSPLSTASTPSTANRNASIEGKRWQ